MKKIQVLKYKTKDGNKMELKNASISMGIGLLFLSANQTEREEILKELAEDHQKMLEAEAK